MEQRCSFTVTLTITNDADWHNGSFSILPKEEKQNLGQFCSCELTKNPNAGKGVTYSHCFVFFYFFCYFVFALLLIDNL